MTRTMSFVGPIVLITALLAQPAAAGEAHRFQRLFNHYNSIRLALAGDSTLEVPYHAGQLGVLARALAREMRSSGKEGDQTIAEQLRAISDAAREVAYSADLKAARAAFATLSRALLAYKGAADVENPVLVFCPLHNNVWLQRSEDKIGNPYMGAQGSRCGETLRFRKPRWFPSRPSWRSPGEQPLQAPGGGQGT